jgi:hypothetical protein
MQRDKWARQLRGQVSIFYDCKLLTGCALDINLPPKTLQIIIFQYSNVQSVHTSVNPPGTEEMEGNVVH